MAAVAEAQAEEPPSPPPPRTGAAPAPEKRGAPTDGEERRPEAKRRRARVAALEGVPRAAAAAAAAASEDDGCEGGSFSFHARGFSGVAETTPKFGSFNPAAAQFVPFHLTTPPPPLVDLAEAVGDSRAVAGSDDEEKGKDGNSH